MVLCVWGGFMMSIKGGVRRRHPAWMKETHMYAHIDDSSLVLIFHCLQTCFFPHALRNQRHVCLTSCLSAIVLDFVLFNLSPDH